MSATYYGETTVECYHDCRQTGCQRHHVRLVEKHGGCFFEEFRDGAWHSAGDLGDVSWVAAAARLMRLDQTPERSVEQRRARLETALRAVRAELVKDGYTPTMEPMATIDAALEGE